MSIKPDLQAPSWVSGHFFFPVGDSYQLQLRCSQMCFSNMIYVV